MTRIISKFHDYYDSAQSQGADRDRVYVRAQEEFSLSKTAPNKPPAELFDWAEGFRVQLPKSFELPAVSNEYRRLTISAGVVLFAGRLYPFAELEWGSPVGFEPKKTRFVYEYEELEGLLAENDYVLKNKAPAFWERAERLTWKQFFELAGSERWRSLALEKHWVILSYADLRVVVNPRLADLEFYRKLNSWQAYQELTMFTGTLASPERVPVVIDDKYRVAGHGFDEWSFRKLPSKRRV